MNLANIPMVGWGNIKRGALYVVGSEVWLVTHILGMDERDMELGHYNLMLDIVGPRGPERMWVDESCAHDDSFMEVV